ncbi:hypothetical protein [Aquabacterium humicola]|uniref:hypothetical protein n=1 Tax=Aquabacterium humicola TaxID=3237377 RepID=UPI0025430CFB|nr:hypothetical protein [Rubrivivax pictus]
MKRSLNSFAALFGTCVAITVIISLFTGLSASAFINIGSYVGALALLLGCWRLLNSNNDAIDQTHAIQQLQNFRAEMRGKSKMHLQIIPMFLSSGALVSAGLVWLVILQTVRYTFGIVLE